MNDGKTFLFFIVLFFGASFLYASFSDRNEERIFYEAENEWKGQCYEIHDEKYKQELMVLNKCDQIEYGNDSKFLDCKDRVEHDFDLALSQCLQHAENAAVDAISDNQ